MCATDCVRDRRAADPGQGRGRWPGAQLRPGRAARCAEHRTRGEADGLSARLVRVGLGLASLWGRSRAGRCVCSVMDATSRVSSAPRRWSYGGEETGPDWRRGPSAAPLAQLSGVTPASRGCSDYRTGLAARMLDLLTRLGDNAAVVGGLEALEPKRRFELVDRIVAGTAADAPAACADLLARLAATAWPGRRAGLRDAAIRLVAALPGDPARDPPMPAWQVRPQVEPGFLVALLTGLDAIDAALAVRAADHVLAWPATYGLDRVIVPALCRLAKDDGALATPAGARLRAAALAHLRTRIAEPLAPPADWRRASQVSCRCTRCQDLARYLDDPSLKTWTFKAAESDRRHVEETIRQAGSDVETTTDRRGRPYSLVCTKNQASYERRARQRTQDLKDVALLAD